MQILMSCMKLMTPLMEIFMTRKIPTPIGHSLTQKEIEQDGITKFVVYDVTSYATPEESKKHIEIQEYLNSLAKQITK